LGVRFPREVPTSSTCTVQRIVAGMFREDPMQHSLAAKVSDELESGIPCPPRRRKEQLRARMSSTAAIAPGSVVIVRDEEWLVTKMETTDGVSLLSVQGLSELVRGTSATFLDCLDKIEVFDPASASLVADDSPSYRRARLWLEATARKTPIPLADRQLAVSTEALATQLAYQQSAVLKAIEPERAATDPAGRRGGTW
jgi:hypothetical protein